MTHRPRRRDQTRRTTPTEPSVPLAVTLASGGSATLTRPAARPVRPQRVVPAALQHSPPLDTAAGGAVQRVTSHRLSVEAAFYLVLIAIAALTRFWDLGKRALHHDEALHAYYSWTLSQGQGYVHDPLMHGPFLFESNALVYLLFGDSDATSRFLPALAGVLIVATPWLLRAPDLLGRAGALTASLLLLISPSFFYYTRYIRHDPYTALGSILLFTCIVRYRQAPERRWLIAGGITLAVLFANHEIVFALVAIFGGFIWGALLWGRLRPLFPVQLAGAALLGAVVILIRQLVNEPLPAIPWDNPTNAAEREYYVDLVTHPLTIAVILVGVAFVAACFWMVWDERRRNDGVGLLDGAEPGSTAAAVLAARRDINGLSIALLAGLGLFVAMFTTFFTNLEGLASGTIATDGTLLYWLGQQGQQRGSQPWFFYLVLAPQYEYLAIVLGLTGIAVAATHAVRALLGRGMAPRFFIRLFLAIWLVLIFAGLSYAGEKMPWLLMHITLPATLLGGMTVDDAALRWRATGSRKGRLGNRVAPAWTGSVLVLGLAAAAAAWFLLAGRLTYGDFERIDDAPVSRVVTAGALDRWWLLALPPLAGLVVLAVSWLWRGLRATGRNALLAIVVLLAMLQVHATWRLSYLQGDIPVDMLMYNQTSPDVTRMMSEFGALSNELYGNRDLVVWYDGGTAWPMQWYLRDYPNRKYYSGALSGPPTENGVQADILIVANDNIQSVESQMAGYTAQEYVLRWHFPEEDTYRNFAIAPELGPGLSAWRDAAGPHGPLEVAGSVVDSLETQTDPDGQQRLYRLVLYRDLPVDIDGYDYTVYVRDDLVPLLNTIRY